LPIPLVWVGERTRLIGDTTEAGRNDAPHAYAMGMSVPGSCGVALALLIAACGNVGTSVQPGTAGSAGQAAGGAISTGGGPSDSGGAGVGGTAGSEQLPELHSCLEIANEAPCPERVLTASTLPLGSNDPGPVSLEGVTDLDGDLDIVDDNVGVLATLGCLRRVRGHVSIRSSQATSLWPLRNLVEVAYGVGGAGLSLQGKRLRQDCGFLALRRLGTEALGYRGSGIDLEATGMTQFELPALECIQHLRIVRNAELKRIQLPSALPLLDGQLWIRDNPALSELDGLENATLSLDTNKTATLPQYQFQNNPLLPGCVAENLRAHLVGLGADPATFLISGNASSCPK